MSGEAARRPAWSDRFGHVLGTDPEEWASVTKAATAAASGRDILAVVAKTLPRNDEVADQLDLLADLMELDAGDYFRIQAYRKAATRIRETAVPVAQLALDGKATQLAGIGKTIEEKIVEVVEQGEMSALKK